MSHQPIQIKNITFLANNKICFKNFSAVLGFGVRIGIIGRNGSGKTTLVKILQGLCDPSEGEVILPTNTTFGYVLQISEENSKQSRGELFHQSLAQQLQKNPTVLILDEPTNHLDEKNRQFLSKQIERFSGILIIISHDVWLLNNHVDILWHINSPTINIFIGKYDNYISQKPTQHVCHYKAIVTFK